MAAERFSEIRARSGLTLRQLGTMLRIDDLRTLRRYEDGERPVSGPVSLLMEMVEDGRLPPF